MDTVGRNKKQIQEYIKRQLEEDQIADQMSLKEFIARLRVARIPRHKKCPLRGRHESAMQLVDPFVAP